MAKLKLTADLTEQITKLISEGNYVEVACSAVGIGKTTFYRWLEAGDSAQSGIFRDFWNAIKKAEAEAETKYTGVIKDAANTGNWTAAAWWLERRYPERWGKRDRLEMTGKDGGPIETKAVSDEQHNRAISALAHAIREALPGQGDTPGGEVDTAE
jgi:transposase